jgi:hypothetical protein
MEGLECLSSCWQGGPGSSGISRVVGGFPPGRWADFDAAKTIQAFSTRLREQIDLDTLSTELLAVVDQTMEPTHVSLWLRPSPHGSSGTTGSEARPTPWAY